MSHSVFGSTDLNTLKYVITHVFCPLQLPGRDDHNIYGDHSIARAISAVAHSYGGRVSQSDIALWHSITRMLENMQAFTQFTTLDKSLTTSQLTSMNAGDVLAFIVRAQNAGIIFRKQRKAIIFESFELSPMAKDVMGTEGKLICSYPGPGIEVPNDIFLHEDFLTEFINFLVHMSEDHLGAAPQSSVFQNTTVSPRYITELLTGVLRSVGRPADITRISKRVGDDVVYDDSKLPWRRSSLWLLIRVALQTTLDRSPLGHATYKEFMLFFMCCIAQEKSCQDLSSDLLHFMSAKISRRFRKLGPSPPNWLSRTVLETCTSLRSTIENRWKQVQAAQRVSPPWAPSQLDLAQDVQLSLLSSRDHLHSRLANQDISPPDIPFEPKHLRRGSLEDFLSSNGEFFEEAYRTEPHVTLYDVERAIEEGIDGWVEGVTDRDDACVRLEILCHNYSTGASKTYGDNPALLSVMMLTTIELWVALDKIAVKEIPILGDYSPEIPINLLEELLLCKSASIDRLCRAHEYLSLRHSRSRSQWSVFSSTITAHSFAVRFYKRSPRLRRLKAWIEGIAKRQVREKIAEMREMKVRYERLQKGATKTGHTDYDLDMRIDVYEWPLPGERLEAESVVFELDCPVSFNMWRTVTFHVLVDLYSPPSQEYGPPFQLNRYRPLQPYLVEHPRSRISLGSKSGPSITSHPTAPIPAKREVVCIQNGLTFFAFDTHTGIPVSEALPRREHRGHYFTYKLPTGRYQNLQKYVGTTSHTSNEVIANQAECHEDLRIHEYMAFGHLRSGGLLQWLNILRELRGRSLSFRRHEVHMLLVQTASQIGPLTNMELTWHQEIRQPTFCYALLGELRGLVHDIGANWMEGVTMDTISFLLRRLLASGLDEAITLEILSLLRTVRGKIFDWIRELTAELVNTPGDDMSHGILRDTAAICRSTFDVEPSMTSRVLHSAEDIEVLLSSAIIIHDHMPSNVSRLPAYSQLLVDRDRRFSLVLESVTRGIIQTSPSNPGINRAVRRIWPDFNPGSTWTPLEAPNSRWLSCKTAPPADQVVHFNILDGSLLVNGKPLGTWLPDKFLQHPLYNLIFGEKILEVLPGGHLGMDYSTRDVIANHQVYFSLRNYDSDLVIRAKRVHADAGSSEIMELIPHQKLEGDLPAVLIEGHAHWLNLSTAIMEIRPLESLWEASAENWTINCTLGHYRMWKGHKFLLDIRSRTWDMVSSLLKPLSSPQHLIIVASPVDDSQPMSSLRLSVVLPHYGLSFYVDEEGDLQSYIMQGMVYDENQSIGTLFGLVNQLVLRPKVGKVSGVTPRCVLIPDGTTSFQRDGSHVRVEINASRSSLKRIGYQAYTVDTDLGCLVGNTGLTGKLHCVYLHALTSGCSADPLTGRSGTEEALSVLQSASCWSTARLSSRDAELLKLIASICPPRTWLNSEQSVQEVKWHNIPMTSQHHELYILAKEIKERYEQVQLFHEGQPDPLFKDFPLQDDHLLKRGAQRAAYLFPSKLSVQLSGTKVDTRYPAEDPAEAQSAEHRAYTAATHVYCRFSTTTKDIWEMIESWKKKVHRDAVVSLRYNKSWLAPDLPSIWLKVYDLLRGIDERKWFQILFSLPAMVYASEDLSELVPIFVAFASHSQLQVEDPPHYDSYSISAGYIPSLETLRNYIAYSAYALSHSPERLELAKSGESQANFEKRRLEIYNERRCLDAGAVARELLDAWPCEIPPTYSLDPKLYDVGNLAFRVQSHFSDCFRNFKLKEHVNRVQTILHSQGSPAPDTPQYTFHLSSSLPSRVPWELTVYQLLTGRPPPLLEGRPKLPRFTANSGNTLVNPAPLQQLISMVGTNAVNSIQRQYVTTLENSAKGLKSDMSPVSHTETIPPTMETLLEHHARSRTSYIESVHRLQEHLSPRSHSEQALEQSGQWPRITAHTLFRLLASNSPIALPDDWRRYLTGLILLALELQRSRRLLFSYSEGLHEEFYKELQNEGCDSWDAEAYPDWLLIQLQGNFLIRRVQAKVASEMISPCSGENTVMQLNMGEGKTSIIVPIVAAVLADGDQLVRVIVPKPLATQTLHVLVDRLNGFTNRRIYYLPFSRSLDVNDEKVACLRKIMLECMQDRGILMMHPEHALSLKLVGIEKQLSQEEGQLGHLLLELQKWLHSRLRDILDESDEVLDVRSQLVFTIGRRQPLEGSSERWITIQQLLGLVSKHAFSLRQLFPLGVEYEPGPPGSFPYFRVLQADAGEALISLVVKDILGGLLGDLSFGQLHSGLRDAIESFISCEDVPQVKVQLVKDYSLKNPLWSTLLLLRGFLTNGVLLYAVRERRWRVDYGLFPTRTMLAVPYRAKDMPSQRAEFGHPDVAIILTCLSYYYGGLSEEQLKLSFEILFKEQDPSLDYNIWVQDCPAVPGPLLTLSNINIESGEQWNELLFPLFSRNRATINFYLAKVVFPREAKEFPSKLPSSGWDLAEKKERLLTGFCGTNDGQYLLPLQITQRDPDHQRGTNAKVLSYLLQPENNYYMCTAAENGKRRTTREFLQVLVAQQPQIRVLLDVGALMLDLQNGELAEAWLDINRDASAAVYLDDNDELTVRTRDGNTQPLQSSPFAQQLDRCVVYLDDAHTRGIDIKLPSSFRAAITLGPRVTKDRLAQGCMRMRKLGHGQSIMFFAPLEVDRRIRSMANKNPTDVINTTDIVFWAIRETWDHIQRWAPHWVQQGIDHTSRYAAWSGFCANQLSSSELSEKWIQQEAKSLEHLYAPRDPSNLSFFSSPDVYQRCMDLGVQSLRSVGMDEEHERELVYEVVIRAERQVERPVSVKPAKHSVHPDIANFVKTGVLPTRMIFFRTRPKAFKPVFETLDTTSAATEEAYVWSQSVLATKDFEETVETSEKIADYVRPVHWVVSARRCAGDLLVALSPFEVNALLPDIRSSQRVHLHPFAPRITKAVKSSDDLSLYSIPAVPDGWIPPSVLMDQLSVFAGQLYLKDYETYVRLCRFLCIYTEDLMTNDGVEVEPDGFVLPKNRRKLEMAHTFQKSPTVALRALMELRSNGIDFAQTHMGKLLRGQLLSQNDFVHVN